MNKGLPIFKMANKSIKGWFPTTKDRNNLIPFVSTLEEDFLYYAEYNPMIISIERADIDESFTDKYKLSKTSIVPVVIPYTWEDRVHNYYPDFLVTLANGETIIVEVGRHEEKMAGVAIVKATAAIDICNNRGWHYWLVTDQNIMSKTKKDNLILLKSFDKPMYKNQEIQSKVLEALEQNGNLVSIEGAIDAISKKHPRKEVEMATYELINSIAKEGRIAIDYDNICLSHNSIVKIIDYSKPAIIPDPIHIPYKIIFDKIKNENILVINNEEIKNETINYFIDTEGLAIEDKEMFFKRRAAVLEAISNDRKDSIALIANRFQLKRSSLYDYINNYLLYGEKALIPYFQYRRDVSTIPLEVREVINKLRNKNQHWTIAQLQESDELKKAIVNLSRKNNILYNLPSYQQIYRYLKKLEDNPDLFTNVNRHKSRKIKITTYGAWVNSISNPMDQVQVDANYVDIKIVTNERQSVAGRLWAIVLIDVKTAMILGYSLSLKAPMEEDYMMALKCCIEPKDKITRQFNCKNNWPTSGIPRKILSDNGMIFISKRSTDVLVKRFGIVEEIAPPYTPDVKGTIEALFTWTKNRLVSRLPGYTKDREHNEVIEEVLKNGVTFEEFEEIFVQAIVDVYNIEWDNLRGHTRYNLWISNEIEKGVGIPSWLGSSNELKLLLMKEEESRKVDRHGISFKGRYYQNKTMIGPLIDKNVFIRYDKRDISVIYVFLEDGKYYCEAYCQELLGKRISVWEDQVIKKGINIQKDIYNARAKENEKDIVSRAKQKPLLKEKKAKLIEQSRIYDKQDIHIDKVNAVLDNIRNIEKLENPSDVEQIDISTLQFKKPVIRNI
jgi:hypothetical protein